MKLFSLRDVYQVDIDLLDAQHKVILIYMNKVYNYLTADKMKNRLLELADRLVKYCKLHYQDEEMFMEETNFPEIVEHKAQHVLIIANLEGFLERCTGLNTAKNIEEILLLKEKFLEHLEKFDRKYAKHKKQLDNMLTESSQ